jgi:Ni/Co efflux regulator RcnB
MKRISFTALSAGLGLALLAAPLAMAQQYQDHQQSNASHGNDSHQQQGHQQQGHQEQSYQQQGHQEQSHQQQGHQQQGYQEHESHAAMQHQWHDGDRYTGHRYVVSDWNHYHVHRPPSGYEWVHDGNQLVMIAIGTGLIASALANGY